MSAVLRIGYPRSISIQRNSRQQPAAPSQFTFSVLSMAAKIPRLERVVLEVKELERLMVGRDKEDMGDFSAGFISPVDTFPKINSICTYDLSG
jgi:hypothetical protein